MTTRLLQYVSSKILISIKLTALAFDKDISRESRKNLK
jgi:hypothetical protein